MQKLEKLFGGIKMPWWKVIVFAIVTAAYTALINQVPVLKNTSLQDIAISYEWWILFAILIITNAKSNLDAALKTLVFFAISQPLIFLIEVPFVGWSVMGYLRNWAIAIVLTFPMAFVGYFMKKDKWWGLLILAPMLAFLGYHYYGYFAAARFYFPHHLASAVFCVVSMFLLVLGIFKNKKLKLVGVIINVVILISATVIALLNPTVLHTTLVGDGGSEGAVVKKNYTAELENSSLGSVNIIYDEGYDGYLVDAAFVKGGKTVLTITAPDGKKQLFDVNINEDGAHVNAK